FVNADGTGTSIYDTVTGRWSSVAFSQVRKGAKVTTVGDQVLFAGGYTGVLGVIDPGDSDVVAVYDAATRAWSVTNPSRPRRAMGATSVGTDAIFAGGDVNYAGVVHTVDVYTDTAPTPVLSG